MAQIRHLKRHEEKKAPEAAAPRLGPIVDCSLCSSTGNPPLAWVHSVGNARQKEAGLTSRLRTAFSRLLGDGVMDEALECARFNAGRAERAFLSYTGHVSDDDAALGVCEAIVNIEFDYRRRGIPGEILTHPESNEIIMGLLEMGESVLESRALSGERRALLERILERYPPVGS